MKSFDATPPKDFPAQVVIMDASLAKTHPDKVFYLRVTVSDTVVDLVSLDGAVTPLDARELARAKGYAPTHWMRTTDASPWQY